MYYCIEGKKNIILAITLIQRPLKIVIIFNSANTETQIRNYLINTVWPALQTKINTKMDNNFVTGWSKGIKLSVGSLGINEWQVYPKFWISGTTNLTVSQLRTGLSDLLRNLKTTLKADFESQGATNVRFHVHYQDGRTLEVDED